MVAKIIQASQGKAFVTLLIFCDPLWLTYKSAAVFGLLANGSWRTHCTWPSGSQQQGKSPLSQCDANHRAHNRSSPWKAWPCHATNHQADTTRRNSSDADGNTALMVAVRQNNWSITRTHVIYTNVELNLTNKVGFYYYLFNFQHSRMVCFHH